MAPSCLLFAASDAYGPGCLLPHVLTNSPQMAPLDLVAHADLQTQQVTSSPCVITRIKV